LDDFFKANQKHNSPIHILLMCTNSDEMKIILALIALFSCAALSAQTSDSVKIKASDPTQLYTFVEGYGGLNFIGYNNGLPEIDTWQFGFRGNWAMKKFRMGVDLSASNNSTANRVLDDVLIDMGYQIHNNTGIYNATVINAGFISPSQNDLWDSETFVYPKNSMFATYYFNYLGAIKISEKLAFYPGVEWFSRKNDTRTTYIYFGQDSSYSRSTIFSQGWKFSGTISYDINAKNFMQLYAARSTENWDAKYGSIPAEDAYLSAITEKRWHINVKYQHAFSPYSQLYLKLLYNDYLIDDGDYAADGIQGSVARLYSFQLGFTYFLE